MEEDQFTQPEVNNELNTQTQATTTEDIQQEQPRIKVKYNHEEMELPYEEAVKHIAAHVAALGQRVGPGGHEEHAIQHDLRIEHPGVGLVQDIPGEHLPGDQQREAHDAPGAGLSKPGREPVHCK